MCLIDIDNEEDFDQLITELRPGRNYYWVSSRQNGKLTPERKVVCMYIRFLIRVHFTAMPCVAVYMIYI